MEIQNDNIERFAVLMSVQITFKNRYDSNTNIVTVSIGEKAQILAKINGRRTLIRGDIHNILWYNNTSLGIIIRNNHGTSIIPVTDMIDIHFDEKYTYPKKSYDREGNGYPISSYISKIEIGGSDTSC